MFQLLSDSPHGCAIRNTIRDFETGMEVIDLRGVQDGLVFVGGFSGMVGELRYNDSVGQALR